MAKSLDCFLERDVEMARSLNLRLMSKKGFLPDVDSPQLRLAMKAEIERLKGTINSLLSECEANGF